MGWSLTSRGIFTGGILKTAFWAAAASEEAPIARSKVKARRGSRTRLIGAERNEEHRFMNEEENSL
jgi:hypothetical protein